MGWYYTFLTEQEIVNGKKHILVVLESGKQVE